MSLVLDLHSHSVYSGDSRLRPRDLVRLAKARGLDGLAVTDHETVRGGLEALDVNTDPRFHIIPGVEYATEYGHVVGLFLERELDGLPVRRRASERMMRVPFAQVVKAIHAQGGLAILAHPFQMRLTLLDAPFQGPLRVDALEGFNARAAAVRNPQANDLALAYAQERGIPAVGGSDSHLPAEVGRGRCRVHGVEPGDSDEAIMAAIRAGQVTPWGKSSPRTAIPLSQVTRMWTSRRFTRAPRIFARLALTSLGAPGLRLENALRGPLRNPAPPGGDPGRRPRER